MCGIPEITLEGTVDDWRLIRARIERLDEYDAKPWREALAPILDHFVLAAEGRADRMHWQSFYKWKSASGGPYVNGWINVLLPYLLDDEGRLHPNRDVERWNNGLSARFGGGPTTDALPSGMSHVPFLWKYLPSEYRMELCGGFVGVSQDPRSLALRPELGWAVREAPA